MVLALSRESTAADLRGLVQGDAVAQAVELFDEPVTLAIDVVAGDVVPAQVVVVAVTGVGQGEPNRVGSPLWG